MRIFFFVKRILINRSLPELTGISAANYPPNKFRLAAFVSFPALCLDLNSNLRDHDTCLNRAASFWKGLSD